MERAAAGETGSQPDSTPESSGPEQPEIAGDIHYDEKLFEPDGVFGSRGLGTEKGRKIVRARPHVPYEQSEPGYGVVLDPKWWGWQLVERDEQTIKARVDRAPGILMVRHTVALPGVVEGPILPEYRPDWPIFTGEEISWHDHGKDLGRSPITRTKHVASKKVSFEDLEKGGGLFEGLAPYGYGADHFGVEPEGRHCHVDIAKYLFKGQPKIWVPAMPPHKHEDYKTVRGLGEHILKGHMTYSSRAERKQPVVPEGMHRHGKRAPHDHSEYVTAKGLETHRVKSHPTEGFYVELFREMEESRKKDGIPEPIPRRTGSRKVTIPPGAILGGWVGPDDTFSLEVMHPHPDRKRPHRHADYKTAKRLANHVARRHMARWGDKREGTKLVPRPKAPGAARDTTSIAATAASTARRTAPSSGSRVFVSQAYADQAHQSMPSSTMPRRRPPQVGSRARKLVTCVMAKTTTRSKKSSRCVTRCPRSACSSVMWTPSSFRPAAYEFAIRDASERAADAGPNAYRVAIDRTDREERPCRSRGTASRPPRSRANGSPARSTSTQSRRHRPPPA